MLHDLHPAPGSHHRRKILGRGRGATSGASSGRGMKGQKARTSGNVRPGFEGGQTPLIRRIPKRGFTSKFKKEFSIVNVGDLERLFEGSQKVTPQTLAEKGLTRKGLWVKILGDGALKKPLTVAAHAFSKSAVAKIEAMKGLVERIPC